MNHDAHPRWTPWIKAALIVAHTGWLLATARAAWPLLAFDAFVLGLLLWPRTYPLATFVFPVWMLGALYGWMMPVLLPVRGDIHTGDLFTLETMLFGYRTPQGDVRIPAEYFLDRHWPAVDLVAGVVYMLNGPHNFFTAAYLYWRRRDRTLRFLWAQTIICGCGYLIFILLPAAPPWYVLAHGGGPAILDIPGSAAGLSRLDDLLGLPLADRFYSMSLNNFGAVPSLHTAIALSTLLFVAGRDGWATLLAALFFVITCFGAIYFTHHYVIDVLAGAVLAGAVFAGIELRRRQVTATLSPP